MRRLDALESWRGIAACMVALYHLRASLNSHLVEVTFIANSWLFVDFFFVLSGFVIAANYEQRLAEGFGLWRFALLRFGRLYPLHVATLGMCIVLHLAAAAADLRALAAFEPPYWSADTIVANLLLVQGLHVFDFHTWNGPSWSISTEFYTYFLFAAAVLGLRRRITYLLVAVVVASPLALWLLVGHMNATYDWGLIRCVFGFAAGVLVWKIHRVVALRSGTALELAALALVFAFVWAADANALSIAAPLVFAPAVLVFAAQAGAVSRVLGKPLFLALGERSYSIYMIHFVVAWIMFAAIKLLRVYGIDLFSDDHIGRSVWEGDFLYALYFALVLCTATITYRLIEVPGRDWFRRLAARPAQKSTRVELHIAPQPAPIRAHRSDDF